MFKTIIIIALVLGVALVASEYAAPETEQSENHRPDPKSMEVVPKITEENHSITPVTKKLLEGAPEPSFEKLDLRGQGLSKTPDYVFSRTEIEELDLSNNQLEGSLQAEIRYLQNLRILNLSNNSFTGVPAEVGQLAQLEVLNLANNQLTGLPYELGNLSNLKTLDLRGNNYAERDLEIIKQGLPSDVVILVE